MILTYMRLFLREILCQDAQEGRFFGRLSDKLKAVEAAQESRGNRKTLCGFCMKEMMIAQLLCKIAHHKIESARAI